MNKTVEHLQNVRAAIAKVEKEMKKRNGQHQIFMTIRVGYEGEQSTKIELSDSAKGEGDVFHTKEIYTHILAGLRESEDFWLRMARKELDELTRETLK